MEGKKRKEVDLPPRGDTAATSSINNIASWPRSFDIWKIRRGHPYPQPPPPPAPRPLQKACWNSKWLARVAPCVGNRRSLHTCASFQLERFYFSALVSRLLCSTWEFASLRKNFVILPPLLFIYLFIYFSFKEERGKFGNVENLVHLLSLSIWIREFW